MVLQSFRRRGFLGGAALSSGLGVHSAALKQARGGATDRSAAAQDRCAVIQSPSVRPNKRPRPRV